MSFQKFTADYIFDGVQFLQPGKILVFDKNGRVETVLDKAEAGDNIQHFHGILVPGLVNCHCHLELSHMKDIVPPHTGLVDFLLSVMKNRAAAEEEILQNITAAEKEMCENGTVLVADICNTPHTIATKAASQIAWHNLIEVINLNDSNLETQLLYFTNILQQFNSLDQARTCSVLTPHAPYSVSRATHQALNTASAREVISIHNQETKAENELFQMGKGDFLNLYKGLGREQSPFPASGKTSLQTYLPAYSQSRAILLVHNTFITEEDVLFAKAHAEIYNLEVVYCLCPNANLYIENTLPPVELLLQHGCKIVLGTDSYSSNWQLSIASEVKTLSDHFPQIPLEVILQWATSNGAAVLNRAGSFGRFEKGMTPGLVLLEMVNGKPLTISGRSKKILSPS
ncbi:amidohydrolase family protein [Chitinophagaceae bacterium LB-8]|uniref:Amidohydrolase family protein n=1 Tax=Paraflavisolibacter caeni TaxID=2982496 RepID=A0A9X2XUA4_9BACT|nr:amidohydrolase family protein [Paraflavisolibacter caeni]MCU7548622.1 amidohydrolase family protein [Paraflavisolibacter caeni]